MTQRYLSYKEMQRIEKGILQFFHQRCVENGIKYVMGYGSCIGAVRHKGFIPWDDDIDVLVPWSDYHKLMDILSADSGYYHLRTMENDEHYQYTYAKLTDSRTFLSEEFNQGHNIGIYIDIFPVYSLPDNWILRKWRIFSILFLEAVCISARQPYAVGKGRIRTTVQKAVSPAARKIGIKKINNLIIKIAQKTNESSGKYNAVLPPNYGGKEIMDFDLFSRRLLVPFEDTQFYVTEYHDKYLRKLYGDYMVPPPEDQRISRHYNTAGIIGEEKNNLF